MLQKITAHSLLTFTGVFVIVCLLLTWHLGPYPEIPTTAAALAFVFQYVLLMCVHSCQAYFSLMPQPTRKNPARSLPAPMQQHLDTLIKQQNELIDSWSRFCREQEKGTAKDVNKAFKQLIDEQYETVLQLLRGFIPTERLQNMGKKDLHSERLAEVAQSAINTTIKSQVSTCQALKDQSALLSSFASDTATRTKTVLNEALNNHGTTLTTLNSMTEHIDNQLVTLRLLKMNFAMVVKENRLDTPMGSQLNNLLTEVKQLCEEFETVSLLVRESHNSASVVSQRLKTQALGHGQKHNLESAKFIEDLKRNETNVATMQADLAKIKSFVSASTGYLAGEEKRLAKFIQTAKKNRGTLPTKELDKACEKLQATTLQTQDQLAICWEDQKHLHALAHSPVAQTPTPSQPKSKNKIFSASTGEPKGNSQSLGAGMQFQDKSGKTTPKPGSQKDSHLWQRVAHANRSLSHLIENNLNRLGAHLEAFHTEKEKSRPDPSIELTSEDIKVNQTKSAARPIEIPLIPIQGTAAPTSENLTLPTISVPHKSAEEMPHVV